MPKGCIFTTSSQQQPLPELLEETRPKDTLDCAFEPDSAYLDLLANPDSAIKSKSKISRKYSD